jgi:putative nucleotidyltransferase with HDIG domain
MISPDPVRIISKIDDLPTLPRTVFKITELVNDPKSSAKELARIITEDQVLTARLLKLVNSSFYGFPQRISAVTAAIVLLGFDAIRNLLLTTSVFDLFAIKSSRKPREQEQFWDHSLGCAVGAKVIGSHLRHDKIEELFVAGLLHDIGKIVEMMFFPDEFNRVTRLIREKSTLITRAEIDVFGFTHSEMGKLLAERWNLPTKLTHVIAHHHQPSQAGAFTFEATIVHVADIFARSLGLGSGGDDKVPHLDRHAWGTIRLDAATIETLMGNMMAEFEDMHRFLS